MKFILVFVTIIAAAVFSYAKGEEPKPIQIPAKECLRQQAAGEDLVCAGHEDSVGCQEKKRLITACCSHTPLMDGCDRQVRLHRQKRISSAAAEAADSGEAVVPAPAASNARPSDMIDHVPSSHGGPVIPAGSQSGRSAPDASPAVPVAPASTDGDPLPADPVDVYPQN